MATFNLKNLPIVADGLTDDSLLFGAKDGQADATPDPITLLAVFSYMLAGISGTNEQDVDSYTFTLADWGRTVEGNSSDPQVFIVPTDDDVAFPVGAWINVSQIGEGQITIMPDDGVEVRSRNGLTTAGQYAIASLYKRGANEWVAGGDLTL